jgi:hypothetical protein
MTNQINVFTKIVEHLPNLADQEQASITDLATQLFKGESTETLVESQNLAIKVQRAFEEIIFRRALITYEDVV